MSLSDSEIAWIAGGLQVREKNPAGARRLLEELDRRVTAGEPIPDHLAAYLHWAVTRLQKNFDADDAFGLTQPEHRPSENADRDQLIAYLVQRRVNRGESQGKAAIKVQTYLLDQHQIKLSDRTILNIYRDLAKNPDAKKNDPIVKAAGKPTP